MSTIVAAIQADEAAPAVLQAARILGSIYDATVQAVHAQPADLPVQDVELRDTADGHPLRTIVGDPAEVLVTAINAEGVVAAAIGARPVLDAPHLDGQFALEIASRVTRPIALVPPGAALVITGRPLRLLVPLDGSAESATTVRALVHQVSAADLAVEVVILHVFDRASVPRFLDHPEYDLPVWAQEFLARSRLDPGCRMRWKAGPPGSGIAEAARTEHADAVVLGWGQALQPGRSQVVRDVFARARMPVMLVPRSAAERALADAEAHARPDAAEQESVSSA